MAPSYPLALADLGLPPFSAEIIMPKIQSRSEVPTSGVQLFQVYGDGPMRMRLTWPPLDRAEAAEVITFQLLLNSFGGAKQFLAGDPNGATPRGVGGGSPLVKGASQTGNQLATDGWPLSTSNVLRKFDWFQLRSGANARLYCVTEDASSDGSGDATLSIWPALRESPPDNEPLVITNPVGRWYLLDPTVRYSIDVATLYGVTLEAIEAL